MTQRVFKNSKKRYDNATEITLIIKMEITCVLVSSKALKPLIEAENFIVEIIKLPDGTDPGELDMTEVRSIAEYITK